MGALEVERAVKADDRVKAGRPRCLHTQRKVLDTAADLMECVPYRDITVERIAAEAGVGKQTIYRWYDTKAHLLLDAYLDRVSSHVPAPIPHGHPIEELRAYVQNWVAFMPSPTVKGAYRGLFAEAQLDDAFRQRFKEIVVDARRGVARRLIVAAVEAGALRPDADPDLVLDMVFSPLFMRFLTTGEPPGPAYADALLDAALRAMACSPVPGAAGTALHAAAKDDTLAAA